MKGRDRRHWCWPRIGGAGVRVCAPVETLLEPVDEYMDTWAREGWAVECSLALESMQVCCSN